MGQQFDVTAADLLTFCNIQKPIITYLPPSDITTYDHPYPWPITPVGHWVFSFPSDDYFADITQLGYFTSIPAYPPWYEYDEKWPVYWTLDIKYKNVLYTSVLIGHGPYSFTGH